MKAGDLLGEMGLSGSTTHVHLHYQLQDSADMNASVGLPSAFKNYRLIRPGGSMVVSSAPVDTGDIIEHVEQMESAHGERAGSKNSPFPWSSTTGTASSARWATCEKEVSKCGPARK